MGRAWEDTSLSAPLEGGAQGPRDSGCRRLYVSERSLDTSIKQGHTKTYMCVCVYITVILREGVNEKKI